MSKICFLRLTVDDLYANVPLVNAQRLGAPYPVPLVALPKVGNWVVCLNYLDRNGPMFNDDGLGNLS